MAMEGDTKTFRAAQYVRMSTEHQQYSTSNQGDKIKEYADKRGIEIVRTYADDGKSGLSIGGRASLQKLLADVESGAADYTLILVYDVSRWGHHRWKVRFDTSLAPDITVGAEALWEGQRAAISVESEVAFGRRYRVSRTAWRTAELLSPQGGLSVSA